jgi:opacity protein-like surface antigen
MGRRLGRVAGAAVLAAAVLARPAAPADEAPATDGAPAPDEGLPIHDTGRFYFYIQNGHRFLLDDHVVSDADFTQPNGFDYVLGGGGGYNLTDHWSLEFQAHGTEIDLRSESLGKLEEYSNITMMPAVRFRWPLGRERRVVPFVSGGVGWSLNDDNDQHKPKVKIEADDGTIVGSLAAGLDYFLNPNVAIGFSAHSLIYPDQEARITVRDQANRITFDRETSFNQSSISLLAHVRLFPGQPGTPGNPGLRRLLFADHGPFDTDERRVYLYALGGHTAMFDRDFGGDVEFADPGDFNATLGAGIGVNLDRHWGVELQFFDVAPNIDATPFGKFNEVDNLTFLILGRFRWPCMRDRLVPWVTAGLGAGTFDLNDSRSFVDVQLRQGGAVTGRPPGLGIDSTAFAGQVGVGVEYFLNHHLSVGVAVPVYLYTDLSTRIERNNRPPVGGSANFSGVAPQVQVKAYLN